MSRYFSILPYGSILRIFPYLPYDISRHLFAEEDIAMQFKRIRDLREDHDLTQQQVADRLGCQREVYRRYENGLREIPVYYVIELAKMYDVSIDWILGESNNKTRLP